MAPAGCGKTQLIADSLSSYSGRRPVLVLTHTNAGVAALRTRLTRCGVKSRSYRLSTIDGWALRLGATFPQRSGLPPDTLLLRNPKRDYPLIRDRALGLLASGHIAELLRATYSCIWVDEYQDCSRVQHAIVQLAAGIVPTVVLGDPMQAIFGFAGNRLADWDTDVCTCFPELATLQTPWRWINASQPELGEWLLGAREKLRNGEKIDLESRPAAVVWIRLSGGSAAYAQQLRAASMRPPIANGTVLILADSRRPPAQRRFASQIPGASTVEAVDLGDFVSFADSLDFSASTALQRVVRFADTLMANLDANRFLGRIEVIERGSARNPASFAEAAAIRFKSQPSATTMGDLLECLNQQSGVRVYRPAILRACFEALRRCGGARASFSEAARAVREEYRAGHRAVTQRAVGSTLLLKGLEADMAVILDASEMDARHLYVAMTRGARKLVVCSPDRRLPKR